jgi:hypothetical protein
MTTPLFFPRRNKKGGDEQTLVQAYSPREVQVAFKDLMTRGFCNSHYVSHFAAFFIVVGAKTSIAESFGFIIVPFLYIIIKKKLS